MAFNRDGGGRSGDIVVAVVATTAAGVVGPVGVAAVAAFLAVRSSAASLLRA